MKQLVAIYGNSGAGKSTLAKALLTKYEGYLITPIAPCKWFWEKMYNLPKGTCDDRDMRRRVAAPAIALSTHTLALADLEFPLANDERLDAWLHGSFKKPHASLLEFMIHSHKVSQETGFSQDIADEFQRRIEASNNNVVIVESIRSIPELKAIMATDTERLHIKVLGEQEKGLPSDRFLDDIWNKVLRSQDEAMVFNNDYRIETVNNFVDWLSRHTRLKDDFSA